MTGRELYRSDLELIKSKQNHLGGSYWTTDDNRIGKGSPFSSRDVAIMLTELGFTRSDDEIKGLSDKIFETLRPDGRFKISPSGSILPCHTITALRVLCYMGFSKDERLKATYDHLFEIQNKDGGWRCNTVKLGQNEFTDYSNPGVTLEALDAFRFSEWLNTDNRLDQAVNFLLRHWEIKRPIGPCHFGIGTLFMKTEFPFFRYNLFYYCYALSFYDTAVNDSRFKEVISHLDEKVRNGEMVVENPNRRLAKLDFCKKGETSGIATRRYNELKNRINKRKHP